MSDAARQPTVLDDPESTSVCREYSAALLDAAGAEAQSVVEELASFCGLLRGEPEFARLLVSGMLGRGEQQQIIERSLAPKSSAVFGGMLRVLAKHGRMNLVFGILRTATAELESRAGSRRVRVSTATPLSDEQQASLKSTLRERFGFDPILDLQVEPALVGGAVFRVGDTVYDGSVQAALKRLRATLRERCVNEIQRGRDRFSHPSGN